MLMPGVNRPVHDKGAQARLSGRAGNHKGVKRRDLNRRPSAKRGGSLANVRALSAGMTKLFGNCTGGKYPVYSGRNNAEHRAHD